MELPDEIVHPSEIINPSGIADTLSRVWANRPSDDVVIGVAYGDDEHGRRWCKGFAWDGNRLSSTALIQPHLPGSRTDRQFAELEKCAREGTLDKAFDRLSSESLQKAFFVEVGEWFRRGPTDRRDLAHLIRVLFAWLLQERQILPENALWDPERKFQGKFDIHEHILWLFTRVLATPLGDREMETDGWKRSLVERVPYLNGSLFGELPLNEQANALTNDMYWSEEIGLLPILERYDWTLCDKTGYESESALDPSMLGDIFERLMVITEGARVEGAHVKMPHGTYYTPQDIADEMASDAVAGWLHSNVPNVEWSKAKALAHPMPKNKSWTSWDVGIQSDVVKHLQQITVFDPCCGSGAFTLAMLSALRRSRERLIMQGQSSSMIVESIIEKQLYAADIQPLAVLITRLRLFIAWIEACSQGKQRDGKFRPLPNLETRCIAINSLCVDLFENRPLGGIVSDDGDDLIDDLRAAREMLTVARSPDEKKNALEEERNIRRRLREVDSGWSPDDDLKWLEVDLFRLPERAAEIDVRKIFPGPEGGWDIVIGNPPYQKPDQRDKERGKRLNYLGAQNLYLMFMEMAFAVANFDGCISLIVPHSIVFGKNIHCRKVRQLVEQQASRIDIRTYDNRPKPVFPNPRWLREGHDESGQRVTILTACKGACSPSQRKDQRVVHSSGLIRLDAAGRAATLRQTGGRQLQPTWPNQWTQAPTEPLAKLLTAMLDRGSKPQVASGPSVTFPATARYFITCLPHGILENPSRKQFHLPDNFLYPWIGLYNSHLFHAYWLMVGDAFHVTGKDVASVCKPPGWKDVALMDETARVARELIKEKNLAKCKEDHRGVGGTTWPNYNFHSGAQNLIERVDKLLIKAYGLDEEPLLAEMRIIRDGSAHKLF